MTRLKAILLCSDLKTSDTITNFLETFSYDIIQKTQYGYDCLAEASKQQPDVIISDAFNFDYDAVSLATELKNLGLSEKITYVVASSVTDSSYINLAFSSGVDIYTLLPVDFVSLDRRIRSVCSEKTQYKETGFAKEDEFRIRAHIQTLSHELGLSYSSIGYVYIVEAVYHTIKSHSARGLEMTKEIYPYIAKKFNTKTTAVERAIRVAIDNSWQIGNIELIHEMFGYSISADKSRPTNAPYISALTEKVKTDLMIK